MPDFHQLMRDATRLTQAGDLQGATDLIQSALRAGRSADPGRAFSGDVIDVQAREIASDDAPALDSDLPCRPAAPSARSPSPAQAQADEQATVRPDAQTDAQTDAPTDAQPEPRYAARFSADSAAASAPPAGQADAFIAGRQGGAGAAGRDYKLYIPPNAGAQPLPLVVMLHGCTQDADDFAAGTRMNELARDQGVYVLYPVQSKQANPQKCWNWFKHTHQQRGRGEPALIAGMVQAVMASHAIDPQRIYAAGLSAGGAMASILAQTHPDLFAAIGVHSGLAAGSARDLPSALQAMKSGAANTPYGATKPVSATGLGARLSAALSAKLASHLDAEPGTGPGTDPGLGVGSGVGSGPTPGPATGVGVPTIVFHGTADHTVSPVNGEQVFRAAAAAAAGPVQTEAAPLSGSRSATRRIARGAGGEVLAEYWLIDGAPHAWSGGSSAGSYTDSQGPDASAQILRFFLAHPKRG